MKTLTRLIGRIRVVIQLLITAISTGVLTLAISRSFLEAIRLRRAMNPIFLVIRYADEALTEMEQWSTEARQTKAIGSTSGAKDGM
jgi:hypothetical protein